jgi:hypothetical protein
VRRRSEKLVCVVKARRAAFDPELKTAFAGLHRVTKAAPSAHRKRSGSASCSPPPRGIDMTGSGQIAMVTSIKAASAAPVKSADSGTPFGFLRDMVLGGTSGVTAKTICAPLERAKILLQVQRAQAQQHLPPSAYRLAGIVLCSPRWPDTRYASCASAAGPGRWQPGSPPPPAGGS